MRRLLAVVIGALGVLASASAVGLAQTRAPSGGLGTTQSGVQGLFGNRSLGSSFSGGGSNFRGSSRGIAGATTQTNTTIGQITGTERFIRGSRQPGQFVGRDTSDVTNFFSMLGGGRPGTSFAVTSAAGRGQSNRGSSGQSNRQVYRIARRVAFEYPQRTSAQISETLTEQIQRAVQIQTLPSVEVVIQGQTAILRGEVATDHDRDLAEQLARLEAGIWDVRNELTVAQPIPEPRQGSAPR